MDKSRLKTFLLFSLIIISFFQTGELWFGSLSSRNFFYNLWAENRYDIVSLSGEPIYLLQPTKIIVNFGVEGGSYNILKSSNEDYKVACDEMTKVLMHAFSDGKYIGEENLNWRKILSQKSILFKYFGTISVKGITSVPSKTMDSIPKFNQILVVPDKNINQKMNCYFIDEDNSKVYIVSIKESTLNLYNLIDNYSKVTNEINYISTGQSKMKYFSNNVFLPTSHLVYQKVGIMNLLKDKNKINEEKLEKVVNPLFTNPTLKRKKQITDGIIYYIEGNIIVKYLPVGVIEYTNQDISEQKGKTSFIESYQIAKEFLDKHQEALNKNFLLENSLYLSEQKETDKGWEFYFDFRINDIPYLFSREIAEQTGMEHGVKIVVENKKVKLYRRLTWTSYLLDEEKEVNVSHIEAIGEVINHIHSSTQNEVHIKDMYWAYYQSFLDQAPEIYWIIEIEDKVYSIKASR